MKDFTIHSATQARHMASPSCHLHTSFGIRSPPSEPLATLPLLSDPWPAQNHTPSPLPGPPTAFLVASKALTSYPAVYWKKPVSLEPNSHYPLSPFSRVICGSLNLCPNGRTSYSFLNTSHSPKLPALHASPCPGMPFSIQIPASQFSVLLLDSPQILAP